MNKILCTDYFSRIYIEMNRILFSILFHLLSSSLYVLRLGEEKKRKKKEEQTTAWKYNGLPYYIGRP